MKGYFRQQPIKGWGWVVAIAFCSLTLAASCGRSPASHEVKGKLPVYPVTGKLMMDGQPMAGAIVWFHPLLKFPKEAAQNEPHAKADEDGGFKVWTYGGVDGAPAGKYRVFVSWKGPVEGMSSESVDELPEKVPDPFRDGGRSYLLAEVKEGENTLPTWDLAELVKKRASASQ